MFFIARSEWYFVKGFKTKEKKTNFFSFFFVRRLIRVFAYGVFLYNLFAEERWKYVQNNKQRGKTSTFNNVICVHDNVLIYHRYLSSLLWVRIIYLLTYRFFKHWKHQIPFVHHTQCPIIITFFMIVLWVFVLTRKRKMIFDLDEVRITRTGYLFRLRRFKINRATRVINGKNDS